MNGRPDNDIARLGAELARYKEALHLERQNLLQRDRQYLEIGRMVVAQGEVAEEMILEAYANPQPVVSKEWVKKTFDARVHERMREREDPPEK